MGLGRFGGGLGVCRWLLGQDCKVTLTDMHNAEAISEPLGELREWIDVGQLTLRLGEHDVEDFRRAVMVVVNPAIRPFGNMFIEAAREGGARVTSEIVLAIERLNRDRVIGVTGTLGKSTTASMIHHGLTKLGVRAHLGGNIGGSLLTHLDEIRDDDWIVLELSSSQLHWINNECGLEWSPRVAVVTNFQSNHLDWHPEAEHYERCKRSMCAHQRAGDAAILGGALAGWAKEGAVLRTIDDALGEWPDAIELLLPGAHNLRNAAAAMCAIEASSPDIELARICEAIASFAGLPHRLQLVRTDTRGVRWFNDSKSSTPGATNLAIRALLEDARFEGTIHLIAGGYDKGLDLSTMFENVPVSRLRCYSIGTTGPVIDALCESRAIPFKACGTLEAAASSASGHASDGDVVLLSPGCASWDQFTNFVERGARFVELALGVIGSTTA
jgi:UDP-N-acetylmuramoylalanine--D-glutamate ligase